MGSSKSTGSAERIWFAETCPNNRLWSRPWIGKVKIVALPVVHVTHMRCPNFLFGNLGGTAKVIFVLYLC